MTELLETFTVDELTSFYDDIIKIEEQENKQKLFFDFYWNLLALYIPPIILSIGTITNLISIVVFIKLNSANEAPSTSQSADYAEINTKTPEPPFNTNKIKTVNKESKTIHVKQKIIADLHRIKNIYNILIAISIVSLLNIYIDLFLSWLSDLYFHLHNQYLNLTSFVNCKLIKYLKFLSTSFAIYLLIILILILLLNRKYFKSKNYFLNCLLAFALLTILIMNMHLFWTVDVVYQDHELALITSNDGKATLTYDVLIKIYLSKLITYKTYESNNFNLSAVNLTTNISVLLNDLNYYGKKFDLFYFNQFSNETSNIDKNKDKSGDDGGKSKANSIYKCQEKYKLLNEILNCYIPIILLIMLLIVYAFKMFRLKSNLKEEQKEFNYDFDEDKSLNQNTSIVEEQANVSSCSSNKRQVNNNNHHHNVDMNSIIQTIFLIVCIYLILVLPKIIVFLLQYMQYTTSVSTNIDQANHSLQLVQTNENARKYIRYKLGEKLTNLIHSLSYFINFFIYLMINKHFRRVFLNLSLF